MNNEIWNEMPSTSTAIGGYEKIEKLNEICCSPSIKKMKTLKVKFEKF